MLKHKLNTIIDKRQYQNVKKGLNFVHCSEKIIENNEQIWYEGIKTIINNLPQPSKYQAHRGMILPTRLHLLIAYSKRKNIVL